MNLYYFFNNRPQSFTIKLTKKLFQMYQKKLTKKRKKKELLMLTNSQNHK